MLAKGQQFSAKNFTLTAKNLMSLMENNLIRKFLLMES